MEIENIYDWLMTKANIDVVIVILVIGSGYMQERLLTAFMIWRKDRRYDATLKTFFLSIILCGIYIWLVYTDGKKEPEYRLPFVKYFISYVVATSFYEIILRFFKKKVHTAEPGDVLPETIAAEKAAKLKEIKEIPPPPPDSP